MFGLDYGGGMDISSLLSSLQSPAPTSGGGGLPDMPDTSMLDAPSSSQGMFQDMMSSMPQFNSLTGSPSPGGLPGMGNGGYRNPFLEYNGTDLNSALMQTTPSTKTLDVGGASSQPTTERKQQWDMLGKSLRQAGESVGGAFTSKRAKRASSPSAMGGSGLNPRARKMTIGTASDANRKRAIAKKMLASMGLS